MNGFVILIAFAKEEISSRTIFAALLTDVTDSINNPCHAVICPRDYVENHGWFKITLEVF